VPVTIRERSPASRGELRHRLAGREISLTFAPLLGELVVLSLQLLHLRSPNPRPSGCDRACVHRFPGCAPASESGNGRGQTSFPPENRQCSDASRPDRRSNDTAHKAKGRLRLSRHRLSRPDHRRAVRVLDLDPIRRPARSIGCAQPLRDDAFESRQHGATRADARSRDFWSRDFWLCQ
jgi:hypothetical protein